MSVLFSKILASSSLGANLMSGVYASIVGSNIGAYLTPVGALAGIMWMSILKKEKINLSFMRFIEYGAIISILVLTATLLTLNFVI